MSNEAWYLRDTGFSERIEPDDMSVFMRICPEHRYRPGEAIFRDGDPATHLHVIVSGQVKLSTVTPRGQERILAVLGRDDFLGETFMHENASYRADAVALTDVITCPVSRDQFLQLALHAPDFVLSFTAILAASLFQCRDQLGRSYEPVRLRVANVLLEQARRFGSPDGEGGWWSLRTKLRHEEIASLAASTRVAATMAITELRERGLLEGTRGDYRLNVTSLAGLAHEG